MRKNRTHTAETSLLRTMSSQSKPLLRNGDIVCSDRRVMGDLFDNEVCAWARGGCGPVTVEESESSAVRVIVPQ